MKLVYELSMGQSIRPGSHYAEVVGKRSIIYFPVKAFRPH